MKTLLISPKYKMFCNCTSSPATSLSWPEPALYRKNENNNNNKLCCGQRFFGHKNFASQKMRKLIFKQKYNINILINIYFKKMLHLT